MEQSIKIIVYGLVQGVGFRKFTKFQADNFNIKGYVKNLENESVEIHATSIEKNLKDFIEKIKKGPEKSRVDKIEIQNLSHENFQQFQILQ